MGTTATTCGSLLKQPDKHERSKAVPLLSRADLLVKKIGMGTGTDQGGTFKLAKRPHAMRKEPQGVRAAGL